MTILDQSNNSALLQPRAVGDVALSVKAVGNETGLERLRQAGSLKALFPRTDSRANCLAVLVNTAGGITGGDQISLSADVGANAALTLTTQAAERAYRAADGETGVVRASVSVRAGARLNWLPQETIIFDGSALDRRLDVDLSTGATALIVEPIVFGRTAMCERVNQARIRDRIAVTRNGRPLALDQFVMKGDVAAQLSHPSVAGSAIALANLIFVDPNAEALLPQLRALVPATGAVSLRAPGVLALRLVAADSYDMRKALVPILTLLSGTEIPRPWMI